MSKEKVRIEKNSEGKITALDMGDVRFLFDGKGPEIRCGGGNESLESRIYIKELDGALRFDIEVSSKGECGIADRISLYTGIDCYMDKYPDWNSKLFPTMMRCERTHFYGYCMTPEGKILGLASPDPIASYRLLYNGRGHRIYSVELDLINPVKLPERYPENRRCLKKGECVGVRLYMFGAESFEELRKKWSEYTKAPQITAEKWTCEPGDKLKIVSDGDVRITSPAGRELESGDRAEEYGIYTVTAERNGKVSEGKVYCRKDWGFYLRKARERAIDMPQKATTHCESWYGLFSGYLAAKHYPNPSEDKKIEDKFREITPYMFDFEKGEPLVIPERIQNTAAMISLLADRYEVSGSMESLYEADRLSDFLIARQREDGAYLRNGELHYTCVIYIAKSMLELYLAEKDLEGFEERAEKHWDSAKRAVDNLAEKLDDIGTEGEQTFEDGMVSCSALQTAMFALLLEEDKRGPYVRAAEYMMRKHRCLEQRLVPDCRMRGGSLRYWEAQYDVLSRPNMMNSPHGWTAWTLYALYYLYLLTGKKEYLVNLMDGMGACVQLMKEDGELRWAFICDPYVEAEIFVRGGEKETGVFGGEFEKRVIGEEYLGMISGWFRHGKQKVTGGFLECPLYMKDRTEQVDTQGGCCDNDVHEIFKCMEEIVLKKAFIHFDESGEYICYSCRFEDGCICTEDDTEVLVGYSDVDTEAEVFERKIHFEAGRVGVFRRV